MYSKRYIENQVKRKRRTDKCCIEEERKAAIRISQTKYILKKEWHCDVCNNDFNYLMAGKWKHIKTKRHQNELND